MRYHGTNFVLLSKSILINIFNVMALQIMLLIVVLIIKTWRVKGKLVSFGAILNDFSPTKAFGRVIIMGYFELSICCILHLHGQPQGNYQDVLAYIIGSLVSIFMIWYIVKIVLFV